MATEIKIDHKSHDIFGARFYCHAHLTGSEDIEVMQTAKGANGMERFKEEKSKKKKKLASRLWKCR